jgi:FkbM family methyltransferase
MNRLFAPLALPVRLYGLVRSLAMYHGVPGKAGRMVAFYRQFLRPGDLAFDLGAHVGSRVRAFRALGARVIAVEPQPDCLRLLRWMHGRDPQVKLVPEAVAAQAGRARMRVSTATPTVSSLSTGWVARMEQSPVFAGVRWDTEIEVAVTTLDALIAAYGEPAFCKIDVEGHEVEVLAGLSRPLPALSFEYLPPAHDQALAALARVEALDPGGYEYAYSPIETMRLSRDTWMDAREIEGELERFRPRGRSGDVYARRRRR